MQNSTCDAAADLVLHSYMYVQQYSAGGSAVPPLSNPMSCFPLLAHRTPFSVRNSSVDVREHFDNMKPIRFVSNTQQTYTCVDARGDDEHLSTPG